MQSTVRRRPRVVILESDPADAAATRAFLEELGCEVVSSVAGLGGGTPAAASRSLVHTTS